MNRIQKTAILFLALALLGCATVPFFCIEGSIKGMKIGITSAVLCTVAFLISALIFRSRYLQHV
ncbi:hypothetical protein KJ782_02005 [Patescibacteria group bacterium]|nr:hypothetical protein [Patescibacteria group bacterium]